MREAITSPSNYPPRVGKLTPGQIATRSTWGRVPDDEMTLAAMHVVHIVPAGATTLTMVNPLDPGTVDDGPEPTWLERPASYGPLYKHRPVWWMQ